MLRAAFFAAAIIFPGMSHAQDDDTLADIRQELQVLFVEIQRLNRELSTTGGPSVNLGGTGVLERIDAMEAELRRLTGETEELENRINRVVSDGTNRVGDLEFRLCELEADCDIGSLGETPTLGGDAGSAPDPAPAAPVTEGAELAVSEQADFDQAQEALSSGEYRRAADLFRAFTETYTGGPLTAEAHFLRGEALQELGETSAAARAYLDSFSGQPSGPRAADALYRLGLRLGDLGQTSDACATLAEVPARFPGSAVATDAEAARSQLGCG